MKLAGVFKEKFPGDKVEKTIQFGTYSTNQQEVDAVFDLVPVDGELKKRKCIVNSKKWSDKLSESELLEIIQKAQIFAKKPHNLEFPLHLTFTSQLSDFNDSVNLKALALEHGINFLKLKVADQDENEIKFELVELLNGLPPYFDPKMTSIVIDALAPASEINGKKYYCRDY